MASRAMPSALPPECCGMRNFLGAFSQSKWLFEPFYVATTELNYIEPLFHPATESDLRLN
jgi:hypothetical protein